MSEKPLKLNNNAEHPIRSGSIDPQSISLGMPRYDNPVNEKGQRRIRVDSYPTERERQGRTLGEYLDVFGLTIDQVRGKRILDLGSGIRALPAEELQGIAEVFSVSPEYASAEFRKPLPEGVPETRIAARGEALPFRDAWFDLVWVLHVFEHLEGYKEINGFTQEQAVFRELVRVLKPGGTAYIVPASSFLNIGSRVDFRLLVDDIGSVTINLEETPFTGWAYDDYLGEDYDIQIYRAVVKKMR